MNGHVTVYHDTADASGMPGRLDLRAAGGPLIAYAASGRALIISEPGDAPTAPDATGLRSSGERVENDHNRARHSNCRG